MKHKNSGARLRRLARLHGIQTSYFNVEGERVHAPQETLEALLEALGVDCATGQRMQSHGTSAEPLRVLEPVIVAWDGVLESIDLSLPDNSHHSPGFRLETEDGATLQIAATSQCATDTRKARAGGGGCKARSFSVDLQAPQGYHKLICTIGDRETSSLLISAPRRCFQGEQGRQRNWGLFAPLYALRSDTAWGAGSYSELQSLADFTATEGGHLVGTLPLLPCFYVEDGEPSPYLPISRLFWSEFYLDVGRVPFLNDCPEAVQLLESRAFRASLDIARHNRMVDYLEVQRLKREVLTALWHHAATSDALQAALSRHTVSHPEVSHYASFRAASERYDRPWQEWPELEKAGDLSEATRDDSARGYHEFVQWLTQAQMDDCVAHARSRGVGLYLDLPVGVHPCGYDTWRERDSFVPGVATGAPPDSVFKNGQTWGSPPLHPEAIRQTGYDYVRGYLRHHMRAAQVLRVDHVMGMHHVFCIPDGFPPERGTYLRYRPEEMYAVLSLESHRNRTIVIGEDLGTVPQEVRRSMASHGLNRMFVLYYEMDGFAEGRTPAIPANCMASINTHDMPPFQSMWQVIDIRKQTEVGVLPRKSVVPAQRRRERARRNLLRVLESVCAGVVETQDAHTVLGCVLRWLGQSRARFVMINAEDLWLETEQQNIPGVGDRYPSWRSKATRRLKDLPYDVQVKAGLGALREAFTQDVRATGGDK